MFSAYRTLMLVAALALGANAGGCAAIVGDSCADQTDCGQQMFCELSLPGGYCTVRDCAERGCPDEGVCILFDDDTSYCMRSCTSNGDCRDSYQCVEDFGVAPFCNTREADGPVDG